MGVPGLLQFVSKSCRSGTIDEFRGVSLAIDVSCLLHRGLYGCAPGMARGSQSQAYVGYVEQYVNALLAQNCHVILVFDGQPLPSKEATAAARRLLRESAQRAGHLLLEEGRADEAASCFRRSTQLTREVVETTIAAMRGREGVDVIVSPYESDAQLAFLVREGFATAAVTEDSDLIVFGCERVIFKWNAKSPVCQIYDRVHLPKSIPRLEFPAFRRICIMSGCDYLPDGLPGVGLKKASTFFQKTQVKDLKLALLRVPIVLNDPSLKRFITNEWIKDFCQAEATFLHQVVFDPRDRIQKHLTPIAAGEQSQNYSFAGNISSMAISVRLALGNQISNGTAMEDAFRLPEVIPAKSIWHPAFECAIDRAARLEREERQKKETCGAFQLTSKKQTKRSLDNHNDGDNDDDDEGELLLPITSSSQPVVKKALPSAALRNDAPQWNAKARYMQHKLQQEKQKQMEKKESEKPSSPPVKRAKSTPVTAIAPTVLIEHKETIVVESHLEKDSMDEEQIVAKALSKPATSEACSSSTPNPSPRVVSGLMARRTSITTSGEPSTMGALPSLISLRRRPSGLRASAEQIKARQALMELPAQGSADAAVKKDQQNSDDSNDEIENAAVQENDKGLRHNIMKYRMPVAVPRRRGLRLPGL